MTTLFDRESEQAVAEELLAAANGGRGSVLAVEGSAGIGKTRLLHEIRARANGTAVLAARGGVLESDIAFGVVRQLFEVVVARGSPQCRNKLLSGAAAPAAQLFGDAPGADPGLSNPFQMLHALYWLLANMAESTPQLVVIDDAHWADQPSLRFIRYLLPRLIELPVLVVLAIRTGHREPESAQLIEILADPLTHVEQLAPLSQAATAAFLADALSQAPHPRFGAACHRVTGGNPFLLTELARELVDEGTDPTAAAAVRVDSITPRAVTRAVMMRLARLPEPAQAMARALAVLETGQLRHVAALAGLDLDAATEGVKALGYGCLIEDGHPLRFSHPLVRSAVYRDLPNWQRAQLHCQAAHLLADDGQPAELAAAHIMLTEFGADPRTVELLRRAAATASARGSPETAAQYLSRALAEPISRTARIEVLFDLGLVRSSVGDEHGIGQLMESVAGTSDPFERARRSLALADILVLAGRSPEAVEVLERAAGQLPKGSELEFALRVRQAFSGRIDIRTYPQVRGKIPQLLHKVIGDGPVARELLVYGAQEALQTTSAAEASALLDRALAPPGLLACHPSESMVVGMALVTLAYLERFAEFDHLVAAALADVHRRNAVLGFVSISLFRAIGDMHRGRLHEAEAGAEAALRAVPMEAWGFGGPSLLAPLVNALVERGELDRAEQVLTSAGSVAEHNVRAHVFIRLGRGRLRMARGDFTSAVRDFLKAGEDLEALEIHSPAVDSWRCLAARAHLRLGERAAATRLAEQDLDAARRLAGPAAKGIALRTLGMAVGGADGLELLRQAVDTLGRSQARLELAYALVELGAALRRSNRRAESRDPLRSGLDLANRIGAIPLAHRTRAELAATGARPRRTVLTGADALTASERRVAELAATGATNRDIAQALFVTTKTVEKHLAGAYLKLGINSRTQLGRHVG